MRHEIINTPEPKFQSPKIIAFPDAGDGATYADHLHRAAMFAAQSKFNLCQAMRTGPGTRVKVRLILDTLAAAQQRALESLCHLRDSTPGQL